MPNLRSKTWTTTTPANVEDAQYWEDHLISDVAAAKAASSVQTVNSTAPDANGNVDIVALPAGGTTGQVLTKQSNTSGDADWEDPTSSGHIIEDEDGTTMTQQPTLQFTNAEVTNDSVNSKTIVDCKGTKGDPGDAATVTVGTVTTLPAGSSATVTNSGTTSAAVFNFGIPKGADGTGAGDMLKADYDSDSAVELAGGIASYVASQAYSLPTASTSILGGVKVGTNLSIDGNGVLSATDTKALASMTDVAISSASNGQVLTYDSATSKWKNGTASAGGGSTVTITTVETTLYGKTVTLTDTVDTYTGTFDNTGTCIISGVTIIGTATVSASDGIDTASNTVTMPYYGKYTVSIKFFSATVTVTFPYANGATCTLSDGVTTLTATTSPMAFIVKNTGTWTATVTLDGQSKQDSAQITSDGQTAALTVEYGTINLTYDNTLRGNTITCTVGSKTITKTAPNNANAMVFYPPITGNWAITTQIGQTIVASTPNPVVVSSLSTPVSASIQGMITLSVTLYGATEDTISFTDASGASKTETFATGQSSKSVSITILPEGSSITFTSAVAKNPSDLTADYSKTVTVDSNTTEVYVMPNSCLYWYGNMASLVSGVSIEACNPANGWNEGGGCDFNTNDIVLYRSDASKIQGLSTSLLSSNYSTLKVVNTGVTIIGSTYASCGTTSVKTNNNVNNIGDYTTSGLNLKTFNLSGVSNNYLVIANNANNRNLKIHAIMLE